MFTKNIENNLVQIHHSRETNLEFIKQHNSVINNSNFTIEDHINYSRMVYNSNGYTTRYSTELYNLKDELFNVESMCTIFETLSGFL